MFLFYKCKSFVNTIIEVLLLLCVYGLLSDFDKLKVAANSIPSSSASSATAATANSRPFLQIEKRTVTRLTITKPHIPHYLSCIATIEATYDYHNTYFFTWYRNDIELVERNDNFQKFINGTLRLPTNERASGVYRCKINANQTAVLSESVTVEFPVLKRVTAVPNVTGLNDMSITFNCPIISVPAANITWNYGNVSLAKHFNENRFLILTNGSLVLRRLALKHAGKYKCLAHNQYAIRTHRQFTFTLQVNIDRSSRKSPNLSTQLIPHLQNTTQYIQNSTKLELRCAALAENVTIEWWHQRALNSTAIKLHNNSEIFTIDAVNVTQHDGYYRCSTKTDSQQFYVIITVLPSIEKELKTDDGRITAPYMFVCSVRGNPRPKISWYHNGMLLNSSYTYFINDSTLTIHSFDPEENGIYQCFARNIVGEVYSAGEIRYRSKPNELVLPNPLENIACYPHSFNAINVTFDSNAKGAYFITYIVRNDSHVWSSPYAPTYLEDNSFVVLKSQLPVYRPFQLITRVLLPTPANYIPKQQMQDQHQPLQLEQRTMISSLRSLPVTCCTQGMILQMVHLGNDTFVTWSQPERLLKKYFILQFSINHTHPHPRQLLVQPLRGTTQHVELKKQNVLSKLTAIEALNATFGREVLQRVESKFDDNEVRDVEDESVFSIVLNSSVTGILLSKFTKIKMRVLIITNENEYLKQDFRYVQWKIIENGTSESTNTPFHLQTIESRLLVFHFIDSFNQTCIVVCKLLIHFPIIRKEEPNCERRNVINSQLTLRDLKPDSSYNLQFSSCESNLFYGQLDVRTYQDPPGTISNQRVTRQNGLKLSWEPPVKPNGSVHHYNILWTFGNETHEANVLECARCSYKFPNITETAKINITVRVVGDTGVGAPVFIDLRNINHHSLEIERINSNSEVYSGIAIGSLLSTFCVFFFALLIIVQRKRYKARQQGPTHLSTTTDINFGNLSNTTMPGDSAGGLSGSTIQQDYHEMQTLIPKSRRNMILLAETRLDQQISLHPNGNGNLNNRVVTSDKLDNDNLQLMNDSIGNAVGRRGSLNGSQLPLCTSTPERESKPFFIAFKQQTPPNAVASPPPQTQTGATPPLPQLAKRGSFSGKRNSGIEEMQKTPPQLPPNSLTLMVPTANAAGNTKSQQPQQNQQRSGSLTSTSSTGNSSNSSRKSQQHQFHTNYSKHSNSIDGICLLAEEESSATLTPTGELDIHQTTLMNGLSKPYNSSFSSSNSSSNNNNARLNKDMQQAATAAIVHISTKHLPRTQQSQQLPKVPANEGNTNTTSTTSAITKHPTQPANSIRLNNATAATSISIPKPLQLQPQTTTAKTKKSTQHHNSKLQRRPNVDPNG